MTAHPNLDVMRQAVAAFSAGDGAALDVGLLLHVTIRDGQIVEGVDHFHQEHLWDAFWD